MPPNKRKSILYWVGTALLLLSYPVLAHYMIVTGQTGKIGAAVALLPAGVIGIVLAWKSKNRWLLIVLSVVLFTLATNLHWLAGRLGLIYWLQEVSFQFALFLTFASTLLANRKPLCTRFAEMAYGEITPNHAHYAKQITWLWSIFFGSMVIISTGLFLLMPLSVWSIFSNFLYLPLVILMFIAELWVRRKRLPEVYGTRLFDSFKLSWNSMRDKNKSSQTTEGKP